MLIRVHSHQNILQLQKAQAEADQLLKEKTLEIQFRILKKGRMRTSHPWRYQIMKMEVWFQK